MDPRSRINPAVHLSGCVLAFAMALAFMNAPAPARADSPTFNFTSGFGIVGGFGNDGCAANPPLSANQSTSVSASRAVSCFSGFGEISAAAGPGFLGATSSATHTGFGTATGLGISSEFHGVLTLTSATTTDVPVSLNFLIRGVLSLTGSAGYSVMLLAAIQNGPVMFSGSRNSNGAAGSLIPLPDGTTYLVTTNVVQLTTNTPYAFGMSLQVAAGAGEFDTHISISYPNSLTLPTSGPVFNLPEGVSAEIPELNVFDNHWTDPNVGVGDGLADEFGLSALRPSPAPAARFSVEFALSTSAPAALELFDVAGRRVVSREVGSLGAGRHVVEMTGGSGLAPGVYLLRLTQGARAQARRAVLIDSR